jgi:hypothetical protein
MWRRVGGGAALMAPGSLPQRLPLVGNREWVAMRAWRGEDTSPGRSRVFREYPNPKCRVPDLLGSIFLNLVSGSSFWNPNFLKPELPDPKFSGYPNAHPYHKARLEEVHCTWTHALSRDWLCVWLAVGATQFACSKSRFQLFHSYYCGQCARRKSSYSPGLATTPPFQPKTECLVFFSNTRIINADVGLRRPGGVPAGRPQTGRRNGATLVACCHYGRRPHRRASLSGRRSRTFTGNIYTPTRRGWRQPPAGDWDGDDRTRCECEQ